jgi:hypothetical protein
MIEMSTGGEAPVGLPPEQAPFSPGLPAVSP